MDYKSQQIFFCFVSTWDFPSFVSFLLLGICWISTRRVALFGKDEATTVCSQTTQRRYRPYIHADLINFAA